MGNKHDEVDRTNSYILDESEKSLDEECVFINGAPFFGSNISFKNCALSKLQANNVALKSEEDNCEDNLCEKSSGSLDNHTKDSAGSRCPHCQKMFAVPSRLIHHLLHQVCTQPQRAETDNYLPSMDNRDKTSGATTLIEPVCCPICCQKFTSTVLFTKHLEGSDCSSRILQKDQVGKQQCLKCHKHFTSLPGLRYHIRRGVCVPGKPILSAIREHPNAPHCDNCGKSFGSQAALEYHFQRNVCFRATKMYSDAFYCHDCGSKFERKQSLAAHLNKQACKKFPQKDIKLLNENVE